MKAAPLVFGTTDGPLARAQTTTLLERIGERIPRLTCDVLVREMPELPAGGDAELPVEPHLACSRRDLDALFEMLRRDECRALVLQAYDLPSPLPEDLAVACVPDRAAPYDALLNRQGRIMDELDPGSRVGVLCRRAKVQFGFHWPDLEFRILPGGVDGAMETHLRRNEIDGLVLPAAVTETLGIQGIVSEIFTPEFVLPAPGQGAVAVIGRADDAELAELLAALHSKPSARELSAEMAFRRHMISDADLPLGVLARARRAGLAITGATGRGRHRISVHGSLDEAEAAGSGLAQQLLSSPESFADLLEADFEQDRAGGEPGPDDDDLLDGLDDGLDDDLDEDLPDDIAREFGAARVNDPLDED